DRARVQVPRRRERCARCLAPVGARDPAPHVPGEADRHRLVGARDGARLASRAVQDAGVSLTRRQLLIRAGAAAAWVGAGGVLVADRMGAFDEAPPFDRSVYAKPSPSAVAVLKAETYDGDLEGIVLEGLRLVDVDVKGRSVVLK